MNDPSSGTAGTATQLGRRLFAVVITGVLAGLVVGAAVLALRTDTDDSPEVDRSRAEEAAEPTPEEACATDLEAITSYATRPGATDQSSAQDILTVYGAEDERTQQMIQLVADFQSDIYQYGRAEAFDRYRQALHRWCDDHGNDFYS